MLSCAFFRQLLYARKGEAMIKEDPKKLYEEAELKLVTIASADVIQTSWEEADKPDLGNMDTWA